MPSHTQIQQCVQDCQSAASQLRSLAGQAPSTQVRMMLDEAAHHVDMCVRECEWAAQRVQQTAMAMR